MGSSNGNKEIWKISLSRYLTEWDDASIEKYRQTILDLFKEGLFTLEDPEVHPEVRGLIRDILCRYRVKELEERRRNEQIDNIICSIEEVQLGDRIFSILYGCGRVKRKNKKSLLLELDSGLRVRVNGGLYWKKPY
ncbi:hypothetical protein ERICIV_04590 (plasmid) [Paenibacillus larvae subsp. larvae]|uniref:Uncharacterized protein n=1 Tax=Paenibacillus larvae subsp. larvae TaxID=147375 RepID=A0A2L1UK93_9BACL|nr:hypothetical protein [Paenibacillus larvae]AQT86984.1 hypothetical protein B1222_23405 [Paenibacillus larvae subsp. pulvifaciens]AQZ49316.1 hypothetical protein B5S25_22710 [Paenibacillus larvae subsp. pulvifaciens]AVF28972.1 hypothetical protein ERICIII_04971 [Paenibacillus larvae subsp. larvae]AVF33353.1 hypothetical protein ERICIV_04590 [Paenibacillus larvae subsp. larvae]MBH0341595.1 hypothetical protein [Paenibacillus larvae]